MLYINYINIFYFIIRIKLKKLLDDKLKTNNLILIDKNIILKKQNNFILKFLLSVLSKKKKKTLVSLIQLNLRASCLFDIPEFVNCMRPTRGEIEGDFGNLRRCLFQMTKMASLGDTSPPVSPHLPVDIFKPQGHEKVQIKIKN